jgi:2-polyprenyl-6-methoxyphenol hydroxylase-like FAD-dependent oxidoreductase
MRRRDVQFDVVVAGGGVAGSAAAAALSRDGYEVAIVEPGMDASRRLAGELVHPTGASALAELGLLDAVRGGERTDVTGFSVRFGGAADSKVVRLPYSVGGEPGQAAFAVEHSLMRERLLAAVARLARVTLLDHSRITYVDPDAGDCAAVRIATPAGETVLRPRLLVGADGAASPVSRLAGIVQRRERISTLFGLVLEDKALPDPGYGHVFLGGCGPVLAYPISRSAVRVMFDVPDSPSGPRTVEACSASLPALPEPFRGEVARALETSPMIASASYNGGMREIVRGRLALVGDAAGCCHPLTATGLTVCAHDALRLRDALRDSGGDICRALPLYARRRRAPQRTRLILARALYEVFCGHTPESRLMRDGLREYWNGGSKRCATSMALVSTADERLRIMLLELARVMLCSIGARLSDAWREGRFAPAQTRVLLALPRLLLRHAGETLRTT